MAALALSLARSGATLRPPSGPVNAPRVDAISVTSLWSPRELDRDGGGNAPTRIDAAGRSSRLDGDAAGARAGRGRELDVRHVHARRLLAERRRTRRLPCGRPRTHPRRDGRARARAAVASRIPPRQQRLAR